MTTFSGAIFNSLAEATQFVADHPGFSADWIGSAPALPSIGTRVFSTLPQAYDYLLATPGGVASYPLGAVFITLNRYRYPISGLDLTQLATDLTTLRAALALNSEGFVNVLPDATADVRAAIAAVKADIDGAIVLAETLMGSVSGVGGVIAGQGGTANAQAFLTFKAVADQEPTMLDVQSLITRMQRNIDFGGTTAGLI